MLSRYAVILKCELVNGIVCEETDVESGDTRFKLRIQYYPKPTREANKAHYDYAMDCNPEAKGVNHQTYSKKLLYYIIISGRCFWNSMRFSIKDTSNGGKGLFAEDVFYDKSIVTIYPIPGNGNSYARLDLVPKECPLKNIYILFGTFYNTEQDAAKFELDDATRSYVPITGGGVIGLGMFVNSSDVEETDPSKINCVATIVEVWDPVKECGVKYKCLITTRDIGRGEQFIYRFDGDKAGATALVSPGRPSNKQLRHPKVLSVVDSKAHKHFESCVAKVTGKRGRPQTRQANNVVEGGKRSKKKLKPMDADIGIDGTGEQIKEKKRQRKGKEKTLKERGT